MKHRQKALISLLILVILVLLAFKLYTHEKNQSRAIINNTLTIQNIEALYGSAYINDESTQEFVTEVENFSEAYRFELCASKSFYGNQSDDEMGDYCLCFKGDIVSFTSLTVGKGKDVQGCYLTLTEKTLSIFQGDNGKKLAQYEIGLEFSDYLSVIIKADLVNTASIEISTNGSDLIKFDNVPWSARTGSIFVEADEGSNINNCILSYYANGWDKPVWLFGDSYFNCTSSARWTSYLTKNGYDNFMLNGYSGRNSAAALLSLKTELQYATPKEIIWCMGMNDADNGAINKDWLDAVNEVIEICRNNKIILVLATIPTTPAFNNDYKNEYVKNSGYKYIDFAQSVGAYENMEWYSGMLENGEQRIHPTPSGALALYNEAVSTCPELLN